MKRKILSPLGLATALFLTSAMIFTGCLKDKETKEVTFTANTPVYMTYDELRADVKVTEPVPLEDPAKLYIYNEYLFVSERDKGIHIYRDFGTTQPQQMAFIQLPGNRDIAIKGDILYADSYIDLVSMDISDINNIRVTDRDTDVLPYRFPQHEEQYFISKVDREKGVVVDWEIKEVTSTCVDMNCLENPGGFFDQRNQAEFGNDLTVNAAGGTDKMESGIAGSLSRFMIYQDYLYAIDSENMKVFSINDKRDPVLEGDARIAVGIETLHLAGNNLFIGANNGMYIYSLEDPTSPEYVSQFEHATGCDPVFVSGQYAYVTLRSGNFCGGWSNQLDVIDISDIQNPELTRTYPMAEPQGLSIDGNILYLCDGASGLKVFNIDDPKNINEINSIQRNSTDVIVHNSILSLIGSDGLHQYDVSNVNDMVYLSTIPW